MSFARPELFWILLVLPGIVALGLAAHVRRRRRVADMLGGPLLARLGVGPMHAVPRRRAALILLAAGGIAVAAAGPQWGERVVAGPGSALDLVITLDVSRSMLAQDVSPDRMERQRTLARRLVRDLAGDRIGLVAFAGRAHVLTPLTSDPGALNLYLDALDPEIVSQGGSTLSLALRQATDLVRGDDGPRRDRVVILISDGEALEPHEDVLRDAARAARAGVVVHTVGIGTAAGAPVPLHDRAGRVAGYTQYRGETVISRIDASLLREIADRTGGRYFDLREPGATASLIASVRGMERGAMDDGSRVEPRNRAAWFLVLAFLFLALDALLAAGATAAFPGMVDRIRRRPRVAAGARAAAVVLIGVAFIVPGFGRGDLERGNRLYAEGRYAEAVEVYLAAVEGGRDSPVLHYNLGTALLRLGRYEESERHLRAALESVDPTLRHQAYYNLGGRYLEEARSETDPATAARLFDAAADAYRRALRLAPEDVDAKWNFELALRERDDQPPAGGGGDGATQEPDQQDDAADAAGHGGESEPSPPSRAPRDPGPEGGGALTPEEAEAILRAAEHDERDVLRERLRRANPDRPVERDW